MWATSPPANNPTEDQEWKVAYRVVASDGHPVSGTFTFTVLGAAAATTTPGTGTAKVSPSPSYPSTTGNATVAATDSRGRDASQRLGLPLAIGSVALLALLVLTPILVARRRRNDHEEPPSSSE